MRPVAPHTVWPSAVRAGELRERGLDHRLDLARGQRPARRALDQPDERVDRDVADDRRRRRQRADDRHRRRVQADLLVRLAQRRRLEVHVVRLPAPAGERDLACVQAQVAVALDEHHDEVAAALPQRREHGGDPGAVDADLLRLARVEQPLAQRLGPLGAHGTAGVA
jgi:hypothetical protein